MQIRWVVLCRNIFAVLSFILCKNVQNVMGSGTVFCLRESEPEHEHARVTFLHKDTSLLLYVTLWSEDMRLLTCEVNTNPLVIGAYNRTCDRSNRQSKNVTQSFNLSLVLSPRAPCVLTDAASTTGAEGRLRTKRSWMFPGTLWCGTGSRAAGYEQLGMFESADKCCREHDHCQHIIPAFTVNYGVFNPNFYSVSHCDCDQRFRQCLLSVNDTISSMVDYSFFKILRVPCFELKVQKRCTEMYWWGMCKVAKEAPYAIFKRTLPYNNTLKGKYEKETNSSKSTVIKEHHVTQIQEIKPPRKVPKDEQKCISKDPPRGDTFFRKKTNGCKRRRQKLSTVAQRVHTTIFLFKTQLSKTQGHRNFRKSFSAYTTATPEITTNSYLKATSTTQTTALLSRRPDTRMLTDVKATTKTERENNMSLERGDPFHTQKEKSPLTTTYPPAATTSNLVTTKWAQIMHSFRRESLGRQRSGTTLTPYQNNSTTTFKALPRYFQNKTLKQLDANFTRENTNQRLSSSATALSQDKILLNKTDYVLCESFKHLDECRYKIPPLKKRFGLKNLDTRLAYHCACTRRLAHHIQSLKKPTVPLFMMLDLVSDNCFKLPKTKKCQQRKRCSGGFSKASDLLQALKEIEKNDTARVRNSGRHRKGRISVRLYKRCLRLRREMMAPLT